MSFNIDHTSGEFKEREVHLNDQALKRVDDFKYLGSLMRPTLSGFTSRRGLAWTAYSSMEKIWRSKHIDLALKVRFFDASVVSLLLYGCEAWIVDKSI